MSNDDQRKDVVGEVVKLLASLLERVLVEQKTTQQMLLDATRSKLSDDDQSKVEGIEDRVRIWREVSDLKQAQVDIAIEVGSLRRKLDNVLLLVTPWYVKLAKWVKGEENRKRDF